MPALPLDIRAYAERLVPTVPIGMAPSVGYTWVNLETLFWVETAANRTLPPATLLGHRVEIAITVSRVDWGFGDGTTDTTDDPGRPFTKDDHCHTTQCPGWFGHTYTKTAKRVTVTATVTWNGRYRVDGGGWQDIPGGVTGPQATASFEVREYRSILVPVPS